MLLADASPHQLMVCTSSFRHPGAGRSVFAASSFQKTILFAVFTKVLFFSDLASLKAKKNHRLYGKERLAVNVDGINKYATQIKTTGQAFSFLKENQTGRKPVSVVPAPFCVAGYINDPDNFPEDEEFLLSQKNLQSYHRSANVKFAQARPASSSLHLVSSDLVVFQGVTLINPGDELFVSCEWDESKFGTKIRKKPCFISHSSVELLYDISARLLRIVVEIRATVFYTYCYGFCLSAKASLKKNQSNFIIFIGVNLYTNTGS